jgi:protein-disulfide isomerase
VTMRFSIPRYALLAITGLVATATMPIVRGNWNAMTTLTPGGGHLLGNPAARIKLTEYASYTCSHCAHFEVQANGAIRIGYVASGNVSYEVRHYVRDPVDLTVAMLVNCGTPSRFFLNHSAFMRSQATWMLPLQHISPALQARWSTGDAATRRRNMASDLHLYEIAATRGYDRATASRCLGDEAMARRLADQTNEGNQLQISGTPSFLINGSLLAGTFDWTTLRPQLDARLASN